MKKLLFCLAVTFIVIGLIFCALSVSAVTCDYNITDCGTISISGNWCMNQSIYNETAAGNCISIEASDVILDGLGNTLNTKIDSSGVYGIRISEDNVTIRKINISQWWYAIYSDANNTNITNNTIWNVSRACHLITSGLSNEYGHNASITYNTITNASDTGIYVQNSNNNNISYNIINSEGGGNYGLRVYNSRNNYVQTNNLTTIDFTMTFVSSNYNYIDGNIVNRSNIGGFLLITSSYNNLSDNYIYQPNQSAFEACCGSNNNIFLRNNITDAKNHGFKINDSVGNNLTSNIVRDVNSTGFYLRNISNSTLLLNRIINISQAGLQLLNSTYINVTNNSFENPTSEQNGSYGFEIYNVNDSIISYNNMTNLTYRGFVVNRSNNNILSENNYTTTFIGQNFNFLTLEKSNSNQISGLYFISIQGYTAASSCAPLIYFLNSSLNNLSNVIAESIFHSNRGMVYLKNSNNNTMRNLTLTNDACSTFNLSNASYNKILYSISDLYSNFSMGNGSEHASFVSNSSLSNEIEFLRMRFYGNLNTTPINISAYGNNFNLNPTKYPPAAPNNISQFFNVTKNSAGISNNVIINVNYNESALGYALESTITLNYSLTMAPGVWPYLTFQQLYMVENYISGTVTDLGGTDPIYFGLFANSDYSPLAEFGTNPINYYNSSNSSLTFNLRCSDDIAVSMIQLWTNTTGIWQANYTNSSYTNNTWLNITVDGIPDGAHKWAVWCNDSNNREDWTNTNRTFYITQDATNPTPVQGTNPINNYNDSDGSITFDFKCYDNLNVSAIQLWTNSTGTWHANYSNFSYINNTWLNITVPGISQAQNYKWAVYCNDTYSASAITNNRTFNVDLTSPLAVQGTNPINNYNDTDGSITFDMKCYDNVGISAIQLWTNSTGTWHANYSNFSYTNNTWLNITVPGISDFMNYKWAIWCNDTVGFSNITQNRTFNVDKGLPVITITTPSNNSYFNYAPFLNGSCADTTSGVFSIYTNATEYSSLNLSSPFNFSNTSSLTNKVYLIKIFCNDSVNNTATSLVNFTYDTINPSIIIISPDNGTQEERTLTINLSVSDANPSRIWLNWNGNPEQNQTWTNGYMIFEKHNLFDGNYTYNITINDLARNSNQSETRWIYINATKPNVELVEPTDNNHSNSTSTNFTCNLTATTGKTMVNVTFYWNYTGDWLMNGTASGLTQNNEIVTFNRSIQNKSIIWNCFAYDNESQSAWSTKNYTFTSDISSPVAYQGTNPIDNYNSSISSVTFDMKCIDDFAISTLVLWTNTTGTWHANYSNFSYTNNTWLNITVPGISDAVNYKWYVNCTDQAGNSNTTQNKTFSVDTTYPVASFGTNTINGTITNLRNITFDLKCSDNQNVFAIALYGDWNDIWNIKNLTLDPGNDTLVNYNYTLDASEEDQSFVWNVFCNDSADNSAFNSTNRTFILDTTAPVVSLNYPENRNHTNSTTVIFNCSATDTNLSNITLYENWTGTWHENETIDVSGPSNSATFTKILAANAEYFWNCQACDPFSQCANNSQNYTFTFTIDTIYPSLSLVSPANNEIFAAGTTSITFRWNVSDNLATQINCTVYAKSAYQTLKTCNNATLCEQIISGYSYGDHTWRVNCSDGINQNISETRSFTIERPSEGEGGGGGGGGGEPVGYCGDGSCNRSSAEYFFNCSAYGYSQLYNISLYGSWPPGWHIDELRNIEGQNINVSFKKIFDKSGVYIWNCYVCGRLPSGYLKCSFIMSNKTATIVTTGGEENRDNCCIDCGCPSGQSCLSNSCTIIESCGDGICDSGENSNNCCYDCECPSDQICTASGCTSQSYCGDHVCDVSIGETLDNCPLDCFFSAIGCGDNYCDRSSENVATCPQDCKPICGNKVCEGDETQDKCCRDCGCPSGQDCTNNKCSKKSTTINLSGIWNFLKKGFLPLIIIIIAILIALGAYLLIRRYKEKSLIQVMMNIGKEIDKKKVNEVQARIKREQVNMSHQNKNIKANIDTGLRICKELLKESIEKGEITAVQELVETKKRLLNYTTILFEKYIDVLKKEKSPFEHNLKKIMFSEEIPIYDNLKKTISHLYNVGRKIKIAKSPIKIGS